MEPEVFRQRRGHDALADLRLDQHVRLAVLGGASIERTDIERGVRPRRLREILDDAGDVVVALDQQDVTGLERGAQRIRSARRERLIAGRLLLQVTGKDLPEALPDPPHDVLPCARLSPEPGFVGFEFKSQPVAFWFTENCTQAACRWQDSTIFRRIRSR
jgi:PAS domain-containing protein